MPDGPTPERWLPIPGYEGAYEVSDQGRVRSLDRTIYAKDGRSWPRRGQMLTTYIGGKGGYLTVGLPTDRRNGPHTVHTLVMRAFVGPPPDGMEVRHLNGDSIDSQLSNLAYGTALQNEADKRRHGTHHNTRRVACRYGHRLILPNLVEARLPGRICLACNRARPIVWQATKRGVVISHQALSDKKYRAIMGLG